MGATTRCCARTSSPTASGRRSTAGWSVTACEDDRVPARTDLTLTEAAVLALLAIEGECSGYDLLKLAQKSVGHVWAPAKSQLYATLGRLTRAGLVEG